MGAEILTTRSEYDEHKDDWEQIQVCTKGERAVKKAEEKYLPFPVALSATERLKPEFKEEYAVYLQGASFTDYTSQQIEDLTAGIFRLAPIITDLPEQLEYLDIADITRSAVVCLTTYGRGFVLCDYPTTESQPTLKDEEELGLRPSINVYEALDVLSWKTTAANGNATVTQVVLREEVFKTIEGEDEDRVHTQYRELEIIDKIYTVTLYDEAGEQIGEPMTPKANGQNMTRIPGCFIGVTSNTAKIDKSPVLGISNANMKHYQTWAELGHTQTYIGHPQLAITGAPDGFVKKMKDEDSRVSVGASRALVFEGEKASVQLLEINAANLIHFKTLDQLEKSMMDQGARLKSANSSGGAETAEAIKLRSASDISTMAMIAGQSENMTKALLPFAAEFMGATLPETFDCELNKTFVEETPDPQIMTGVSSLVAAQQVPIRILYDYMKRTGLMREDEDVDTLQEEARNGSQTFAPTVPGAAE